MRNRLLLFERQAPYLAPYTCSPYTSSPYTSSGTCQQVHHKRRWLLGYVVQKTIIPLKSLAKKASERSAFDTLWVLISHWFTIVVNYLIKRGEKEGEIREVRESCLCLWPESWNSRRPCQVSSFVESRGRYVFVSDSRSHFSILAAIKAAIIESVIALSQSMQQVKVNSNHRLILISWSESAESDCTLIPHIKPGIINESDISRFWGTTNTNTEVKQNCTLPHPCHTTDLQHLLCKENSH